MANSNRICSVKDCSNEVYARNLCEAHYKRLLVHGDVRSRIPLANYKARYAAGCVVENCGRKIHRRCWCIGHYFRWLKHGEVRADQPLDPKYHRNRGRIKPFIKFAIDGEYSSDCLLWPFGLSDNGYGSPVKLKPKIQKRPHQIVCEAVYGPASSPYHEVAHNCGNRQCVNRTHLRWATISENAADRVIHGTDIRGEDNAQAKLTESDVREIRALDGKMFHREIADIYGVHRVTISEAIRRVTWAHVR